MNELTLESKRQSGRELPSIISWQPDTSLMREQRCSRKTHMCSSKAIEARNESVWMEDEFICSYYHIVTCAVMGITRYTNTHTHARTHTHTHTHTHARTHAHTHTHTVVQGGVCGHFYTCLRSQYIDTWKSCCLFYNIFFHHPSWQSFIRLRVKMKDFQQHQQSSWVPRDKEATSTPVNCKLTLYYLVIIIETGLYLTHILSVKKY